MKNFINNIIYQALVGIGKKSKNRLSRPERDEKEKNEMMRKVESTKTDTYTRHGETGRLLLMYAYACAKKRTSRGLY